MKVIIRVSIIYILGKFKNGMKHGYGTLIFSNQEKYEGLFMNGLFEGKGIFVKHSNFIFRFGQMEEDMKEIGKKG